MPLDLRSYLEADNYSSDGMFAGLFVLARMRCGTKCRLGKEITNVGHKVAMPFPPDHGGLPAPPFPNKAIPEVISMDPTLPIQPRYLSLNGQGTYTDRNRHKAASRQFQVASEGKEGIYKFRSVAIQAIQD